ncbi:unnamed protein product [Darwinula stevensoni]|uniref:Kringle domain-containing protein n=1 Tax=Darwinula stevensoni TaxID=69355 RepID=A0A7R8X5M9_9CRUS|nr:unnamed protein product [Darwinula stevensoni]CAG0886094.1 unnamed protein product [Darwinula stevensoni]
MERPNLNEEAIYPNCLMTKMGKEYMGTVKTSETGKTCRSWSTFSDLQWLPDVMRKHLPRTINPTQNVFFKKLFMNYRPKDALNYCRNPGSGERPWCFVSDFPSTEWEYCDIPLCNELGKFLGLEIQTPVPMECKLTKWGGEYLGNKNVTGSGEPCLPWLSRVSSEREYDTHLPSFSDSLDSRHNFCRNPDSSPDGGPPDVGKIPRAGACNSRNKRPNRNS